MTTQTKSETCQTSQAVNEPGNTAAPCPIATCDQESWVKARLRSVIRMSLALKQEKRVGADATLYHDALEGLVNGAAIEIITSLGMKPGYVNLHRTDWYELDGGPAPILKAVPNLPSAVITGAPQPDFSTPKRVVGQLNLDKIPEFEAHWDTMLKECERIQATPQWKAYWKQRQREKRASQKAALRATLARLSQAGKARDAHNAKYTLATAVKKAEVPTKPGVPAAPVDAPDEALRVLKEAAKQAQEMPPLDPGPLGREAKQHAQAKPKMGKAEKHLAATLGKQGAQVLGEAVKNILQAKPKK